VVGYIRSYGEVRLTVPIMFHGIGQFVQQRAHCEKWRICRFDWMHFCIAKCPLGVTHSHSHRQTLLPTTANQRHL